MHISCQTWPLGQLPAALSPMSQGAVVKQDKGVIQYGAASASHRGALHLCVSLLGDLAHKVEQAIASVQGDVVPAGDGDAYAARADR